MATFTDNNNTVALQDISGPQGFGGNTGLQGPTGSTGPIGAQGPIGSPNYIKTDIEFSGEIGPGRIISEGGIRYVGSCIFDRQKELVDSSSTEVKVTLKALTSGGETAKVGLVLNCNRPATNSETILATTSIMLSGQGLEKDIAIIPLNVSSHTFINTGDVLSLWAYIMPTQSNMTNTIGNLTDSGSFSTAQIIGFKKFWYINPYRMTTSNLWLTWLKDYNIKNNSIDAVRQGDFLTDQLAEQTYFANITNGLPVVDMLQYGKLNIYYLQIK